jgi:hypothetical protein
LAANSSTVPCSAIPIPCSAARAAENRRVEREAATRDSNDFCKIQNFLRQKNSLVSREFGFNYSLKVLALRPRSSCASQKILVRPSLLDQADEVIE